MVWQVDAKWTNEFKLNKINNVPLLCIALKKSVHIGSGCPNLPLKHIISARFGFFIRRALEYKHLINQPSKRAWFIIPHFYEDRCIILGPTQGCWATDVCALLGCFTFYRSLNSTTRLMNMPYLSQWHQIEEGMQTDPAQQQHNSQGVPKVVSGREGRGPLEHTGLRGLAHRNQKQHR